MNQSEAALNQLISDNPKSPEVRDLYPYIIIAITKITTAIAIAFLCSSTKCGI